MRRPFLCTLTLTVIASLLIQSFSIQSVSAQEGPTAPNFPAPIEAPLPPPSQPIIVPPLEDPHLPSLALRVQAEPQWAAVGDVVTATITVFNQAPDSAQELTLTLPLPADARFSEMSETGRAINGWRWELGTLAPLAQQVVTATMRLSQVPIGEALLLQPEATARGLTVPVQLDGGVLVTTTPDAKPGLTEDLLELTERAPTTEEGASNSEDVQETASPVATELPLKGDESATGISTASTVTSDKPTESGKTHFVPGQAVRLQSSDRRITVEVPGDAFDRPLTLVHRTASQQRPILRGRGEQEPPPTAGYHRGFGAFHLEATDDDGRQVKKFRAPLKLTVHFTPQQLRVLGLTAETLRIFWFDEKQVMDRGKGGQIKGLWTPQLTEVNAEAGTATLEMDHFSAFQLSDGSSPSSAYLPSLQGWQVSGLTGAASFSYPIDVPAGPAGLKPALTLSYSSAATDGDGGMRATAQSSWVGKGWSLDTGAVALNKIQTTPYSTVNHYALSFGGRSYTLMRAEGLQQYISDTDPSTPNPENPTHWVWRPTDESFIRVRIVQNGVSAAGSEGNPGRGARDYNTALPRYTWQVWDKDGTRYDFSEDIWWMWAKCSGTGAFAQSENNRWLLSSVTDTHGNTITYNYGRLSQFFSSCSGQSGTVDYDVWPTEIVWAGGKYKVEFVSVARTIDTQFDWPEYTVGGPVRETRQLQALRVWSHSDGLWQLVRQYNFGQDGSLRSDNRVCLNEPTCSTWGPNESYPKLTLKSIQRIGNDGTTALPATTFSYNTSSGTGQEANGGWNRLTGMNNGQGGTVTLGYANIASTVGNTLHRNRHRVTTRTATDGRGNSYQWSYTYGVALVNTIGTTLRPGDPSNFSTPTSAVLYYNVFLDGDADFDQEVQQLVQPPWKEFRGHGWVEETDPTGAKTKRSFILGNAGCVPVTTARGSHTAIINDPCFKQLLRQEVHKGREHLAEQFSSGGTKLASTTTSYEFSPVDYSYAPLTGLWRSFSYTSAVDEAAWEGGTTASTKRTEYFYSDNGVCTTTAALDSYGRLTCIQEYDRGTLVRRIVHSYGSFVDPTRYIVDRNTSTMIFNGVGQYIGLSQRFYDSNNLNFGVVGTRGLLTRDITVWNLANRTAVQLTSQLLDGRDTTYGYDSWGNQTDITTFTGGGWISWAGSAWYASSPGNGNVARTTTTTYDPNFHSFPISVKNPLNQVENAGYNYRMGTLTSVTDTNSQTTTAGYDVFGRLSTIVKPGDTSTYPTLWLSYSDTVIPVRFTVAQRVEAGTTQVRYSQSSYDGLGRRIQAKEESSNISTVRNTITDYRYDGLGRVIQQSRPRYVAESGNAFWTYTSPPASGLAWATTAYDALGRVSQLSEPNGAFTSFQYSVDATTRLRWQATIDPNRRLTTQWFDSLDRLVQVQEYSGDCNWWGYTCAGAFTSGWQAVANTTYSYNPLDLLTQVTDTKGNITSIGYDSLGRKTSMSDPDMGTWSYNYDANGNLISQTDAKAQVISFGYDALQRLTQRSGSGWVSYYSYDEAHGAGVGRRTSMSTFVGGQMETYQSFWYDGRGRLTDTVRTIKGVTRVVRSSYDSADRLRTITYPTIGTTTEVVNYGYDAGGRQVGICTNLGGCYAYEASFAADGQPLSWRTGNNAVMQYTYDSLTGRLSSLQVGTATNVGQFFNRSYGYDPTGNVTSITDLQQGQTQTFGYDHRHRLSSWSLGGVSESYNYDVLGNMTNKGGVSYTYGSNGTGTGSGPHQARTVANQTYSYDENGNLQSGGGRSYTWTAENLPATVSSGGVIESYQYDAEGQRVSLTRAGQTTLYMGGEYEEVLGGEVRTLYRLNGHLVAIRTWNNGTTQGLAYLHGDHLGSVSLTTGFGSGGVPAVTSQQEFDPWGKVRSGGVSQTKRNYTGQMLDGTGLLYYNARYYDPGIGRFISADTVVPGNASGSMNGVAVKPLTVSFHETPFLTKLNQENQLGFWFQLSDQERQQAGSAWGPSNPQNLNRYSYVLNNPLRYTDPTGHYISMSYEEALYLRELMNPMMEELASIAKAGGDTIALGTAIASGLGSIIQNLSRRLGTIGGDLLDGLTGFFGGVTGLLSDPTGALDAYNMLKFMDFQIQQFLFWVNGSPNTRMNERIVFWADRTSKGGAVYAYYGFNGPSGKVRSLPISAGTFQNIKDGLGSATNPAKP